VMTMGGRVAEEIVFGRVTSGARSDLEKNTALAYAMVVDYGMSDAVGQVSFNLSGRAGEPQFDKPYSDETARLIDVEVRDLLEDVMERTRVLLLERRDKLEALAQRLLEKEVLNENDLRAVLGERPYAKPPHATPVTAEGEPAIGSVLSPPAAGDAPASEAPPADAPAGDGAARDVLPESPSRDTP